MASSQTSLPACSFDYCIKALFEALFTSLFTKRLLEMTFFASLPAELVDAILGQDMSSCVIKLWNCGDRSMQHKISTGITKMTLVDHREHTSNRFPKFITELRSLRELTVDRDGRLMPYYLDIPKHVRCLPSTLTKLTIRVQECTKIIRAPTPKTATNPTPNSIYLYNPR